jgi:hypothetical protein
MTLYEKFKKYQMPADSTEDFCMKYHKRSAYHDRGKEYMECDLQSHKEELEKYGYTIIPGSSSTTGDIVSYYGKE